jgi:hypothetical protein
MHSPGKRSSGVSSMSRRSAGSIRGRCNRYGDFRCAVRNPRCQPGSVRIGQRRHAQRQPGNRIKGLTQTHRRTRSERPLSRKDVLTSRPGGSPRRNEPVAVRSLLCETSGRRLRQKKSAQAKEQGKSHQKRCRWRA